MSRNHIVIFIAITILFTSVETHAQKRPPKEENKQTRENAVDQKEAMRRQKEAAYLDHRDHLEDIQTKDTKKRMKKNLKKAQKHSQGKSIPWHKRLFRKRKF
jgi:exopolysaccharide biosynthesis protein